MASKITNNRAAITCENHPKSKREWQAGRVDVFFPTCQVRVVRFYVSLFSFSSSRFLLPLPPPSSSSSCRDIVSSVWRAGLQPRAREFSVACWTPTAILRVQCGVPDPNHDPASSVWRPGPQPRSCKFSVAARPQPRSCEFSVAARTPTAIL